MNIIQRFVRLLSGDKPKQINPEQPVPKGAENPPSETAPKPKRASFSDDDSPPGYKIRWHL